jgi:hypothetical protein
LTPKGVYGKAPVKRSTKALLSKEVPVMRCLRVLPQLLLGMTLTLAWGLPTLRASGKISAIFDPWPPFTLGKTGGPPTSGLLMDVASELFRRAEIPYRITVYS